MDWVKIDIRNLPGGEVLAANFKQSTYGYGEKLLGYIGINDEFVFCENSNEVLENCTHYIDIDNYDIKHEQ